MLVTSTPPISGKSILIDQLRSVGGIDVTDHFEEHFYAVAALIRVLGANELYPYRGTRNQAFEFTNFQHRSRSKGRDGEYYKVVAG